ncbi:MAG: PilW family protein [Pseudoalteromonas distincta]
MTSRLKQSGLTLIELMVAMLIGLILSLAAIQLLATNQRTFAVQQALSGLHEDGQMVVRYMAADIRNAGRGSILMGTIPPIIFDPAFDPRSLEGGTDNDEMVVNYFGTSDCEGNASVNEEEVINRYYVVDEELRCSGNRGGAGSFVVLLQNVERFQVQYGIDTDLDSGLGVTQYVNAGEQGDHPVVAIRFALLLSSGNNVVQSRPQERDYYVLGEQNQSAEDRSIRRVFTSTVQLRNYDWEGVGRTPDEV